MIDVIGAQFTGADAAKQCPGYIAHTFVGSQLVPGVVPNDVDVLVLVETSDDVCSCPAGFEASSALYGDGDVDWASYRRGDVNLILCRDGGFYYRWMQAAVLCGQLSLTDRRARVLLHELLRDGRGIETALRRAGLA